MRQQVDIWDAIALVGFFAIVVGAGLIYLPAGFIIFGVGTLVAYYLRELGNVPDTRDTIASRSERGKPGPS